jgi:hypothetical protein
VRGRLACGLALVCGLLLTGAAAPEPPAPDPTTGVDAARLPPTDRDGWGRRYTGGGVYDVRTATGGHYDHVHVSFQE